MLKSSVAVVHVDGNSGIYGLGQASIQLEGSNFLT